MKFASKNNLYALLLVSLSINANPTIESKDTNGSFIKDIDQIKRRSLTPKLFEKYQTSIHNEANDVIRGIESSFKNIGFPEDFYIEAFKKSLPEIAKKIILLSPTNSKYPKKKSQKKKFKNKLITECFAELNKNILKKISEQQIDISEENQDFNKLLYVFQNILADTFRFKPLVNNYISNIRTIALITKKSKELDINDFKVQEKELDISKFKIKKVKI
ncbi:MAG: hypothetical protein WDZ41_01025 [Candidatus Babeliales bacterium]